MNTININFENLTQSLEEARVTLINNNNNGGEVQGFIVVYCTTDQFNTIVNSPQFKMPYTFWKEINVGKDFVHQGIKYVVNDNSKPCMYCEGNEDTKLYIDFK